MTAEIGSPTTPKRPRDRSGGELREQGRVSRGPAREAALAELGRRRDALQGAVIPAWELEARGRDPRDWDLLK